MEIYVPEGFEFRTSERVDMLQSEEIRIFVTPLKKYSCPSCGKSKRKVMSSFAYLSKKHEQGRVYKMAEPVCEDCFELKYVTELIQGFHTDLKKGRGLPGESNSQKG